MNVCIVGGRGKVALRLANLLANRNHTVTSIIRDPSHSQDIASAGATPKLLSLEDAPVTDFTNLFENTKADIVYFSAGSGGKGGEERTKKVDFEGAVKIFDAIEGVNATKKPFLVLVSGVDIRNPDIIPAHYNEADIQASQRIRQSIPTWVKWKYAADLELSKRTAFKWFILRPGSLLDEPGVGKADIGVTHISQPIARDDVAEVLALLADDPKRLDAAAGLAFDFVGGTVPLAEGLDAALKRSETAFIG